MNELVLDASVAVKWAMPTVREPFTTEAARLLDRYAKNQLNLIVPDIFWAELANVLWKGVRRRRWTQANAEIAIDAVTALDLLTVPCRELLQGASRLAFAYDCAIYDCIYVALAIEHNTDLITADEKLASALAARLPVKWLGAFQV